MNYLHAVEPQLALHMADINFLLITAVIDHITVDGKARKSSSSE
jgi:hypothetical protein